MKIRMKYLFGIIAAVLCLCDAMAEDLICPEGCFCLNNGHSSQAGYGNYSYSSDTIIGNQWHSDHCGGHSSLITSTKNPNYNKKYQNISVVSNRNSGITADYYVEEFSEFYESDLGFYGIINNQFVYGYADSYYDMLPCPTSYPNSERGSSSLSQCFKYDVNGQKEYYKAPTNTQTSSSGISNIDIGTVNALVKDLQSALAKAQALQEALNKANTGNKVGTTSSGSNKKNGTSKVGLDIKDLDAAKAFINSGLGNTDEQPESKRKNPIGIKRK